MMMSKIVPLATIPVDGTLAGDLAVGTPVYLLENGTKVEYLIVHQGKPSSLYDASCDGTWLMRKVLYVARSWHSSNVNKYASSAIHSYLNSTFLGLFDTQTQAQIQQVKIPYGAGNASSTVYSGSNGLSTKIFLLSGYEAGWTTSNSSSFPVDGACLSYFSGLSATDSKRIGYLDGSSASWWLRSPYTNKSTYTFRVNTSGKYTSGTCSTSYGVRPALVLPSTAKFHSETLLLKT